MEGDKMVGVESWYRGLGQQGESPLDWLSRAVSSAGLGVRLSASLALQKKTLNKHASQHL